MHPQKSFLYMQSYTVNLELVQLMINKSKISYWSQIETEWPTLTPL